MCFAQKGIPVVLKDAKQDWLDNGIKQISGLWEGQAKRGRITPEKYTSLMGLITPTLKYEDFHDVDMTIEAVPEIMSLKKEVFLEMEKHMRPDALICTNTSGLDINEIASVLKDPSRVMGCHFFSPANVMQLLENIQIAKSSPKTLATGMAMGKLIGKKTVMVGNCDGFVGNRMIAPYAGEAKMLFEEGATIEQIDKAVLKFGMAMGPNALGDLVGQELFWKQRKAAGDMKKQTKTYYGPYELVDWLCEQGRFGMKTPDPKIKANGRGVFIHRGRDRTVDPEVIGKIEEIRKTKGITARAVSDEEIIERLFFPLINEGFKILEEGYVARPSDIDIVYIFGYGFPPAKGGPMFYAENYVGLPKILERLRVYAADAKKRYTTNKHYLPIDYFEPSKLLEACAAKQAEGMAVPPGASLIEFVMTEYRKKASGTGPFSKL
jgi:3-hydroxyacyl-CoA dehydrogenase